MNREIKFRAFDTKANKFIDRFHVLNTGEISIYYDSFDMGGRGQWCIASSNVKLMQYTGRKDKNGKEIYEGDAVVWTFGEHFWQAIIKPCASHPEGQLYAIETINNVSVDEDEDRYTYEISESRKGARNEIAFLSKETEVIGNIYENPELLKD